MNISEASAINIVLDHLFAPGEHEVDDVVDRLVYLADRANKALQAGWDGNGVERVQRDRPLTTDPPAHWPARVRAEYRR